MKATTKSTVLTTLSVLTVVSLMAACGSKKSAPAEAKKADPGTAAPAAPGTTGGTSAGPTGEKSSEAKVMVPGNFTILTVTCSSTKPTEHATSLVSGVLDLNQDGYTLTLKAKDSTPIIGGFKLEKDEKDETKSTITFSPRALTPEQEAAKVEPTKYEFTFAGDDLTLKGENEAYCAKGETVEMKLKRTSAIPAEAPKTGTPTAQTGSDDGAKKEEKSSN